jgi:hypothetical protein
MILLLSMAASVPAQSPVPPPAPETPLRPAAELDQLLGPIALYPDPLIAEILPASTFPSEIVMADRYVSEGSDPNEIPSQGWDPSVQALAHYAAVLKWMDDNLPWTTQLGQAFQNQQSDVMDSIQRLRAQAQSLGNLPSTPQETVASDDGDIEIEPANPDDMYVPIYPPDTIYYQNGVYCTFGAELPIGLWLAYDWNWHGRGLIRWGPGHQRPGNWWHQSPGQRHDYISQHPAPAWRPVGGGALATGRFDRGFGQPEGVRSLGKAVIPRQPAPRVEAHPAQTYHFPAASSAPTERRASAPSESSGGAFGGFQSGREAVESSSRGQSSRATSSPAPESHGGGGGGGVSHGGGGGQSHSSSGGGGGGSSKNR